MTAAYAPVAGQPRFAARAAILDTLAAAGALVATTPHAMVRTGEWLSPRPASEKTTLCLMHR